MPYTCNAHVSSGQVEWYSTAKTFIETDSLELYCPYVSIYSLRVIPDKPLTIDIECVHSNTPSYSFIYLCSFNTSLFSLDIWRGASVLASSAPAVMPLCLAPEANDLVGGLGDALWRSRGVSTVGFINLLVAVQHQPLSVQLQVHAILNLARGGYCDRRDMRCVNWVQFSSFRSVLEMFTWRATC